MKFFNTEKGYGFIEPEEGGNDVFVHVSALQESYLDNINKGEKVEFEIVKGNNGKTQAGNIQILD